MKPISLLVLLSCAAAALHSAPLFDIARSKPEHYRLLGKRHAGYEVRGDRLLLTIPADPSDRFPGVILLPQNKKHFDFSGGTVFAVDVRNLNAHPAQLQLEIVNLNRNPADKRQFSSVVPGGIGLEPGERATLRLRYLRSGNAADWAPLGMMVTFDGFEGRDHHLDVGKVDQLRFFIKDCGQQQRFELSHLRLEEPPLPLPEALKSRDAFYPCIDRFGQYRHAEWPGKLHDESEFAARAAAEAADLAAHPAPGDRTPYGGWASGPDFPATGHFHPVRYAGKWFLADPAGKLFWSFGMNSIEMQGATNLLRREHYFEELPPAEGAAASCYRTARPILRYYKEQGIRETPCFDFVRHNLILKHGGTFEQAQAAFLDSAPRRLKSWGFNTVANWSDLRLVRRRKLPYAIWLNPGAATIPGDRGHWRKFYEVFSPDFENALAALLTGPYADLARDPWCIGFFVNNELSWGDETGLVRGVLRSPAGQPSKLALAEQLRKKYGSIEALNRAWNTDYRSWDAFLESTALPGGAAARRDLAAFNAAMIERYFSTARRVLRRHAPQKLYLGCRFSNTDYSEPVIRIAAKYADVLTFNLYRYSVGAFRLPEGVDKPVLIGEWHFGTLQYGPPNPGLRTASDQRERARAFDRYLRSALWNPNIVGAHYFQYYDQATTGRTGDSENMQIGFLNAVDTPYPELVEAARRIGRELYQLRLGK